MMAQRVYFIALLIVWASILCDAIPVLEREYKIEAFKQEGDSQILILRLPTNDDNQSNHRQGRQEDEGPTVSPYIPAVFPALTQILNGILTGNLNEIFHGSTAFAPQNVSTHINSVYNNVVGLSTTQPTTRRPTFQLLTERPTKSPAPTRAATSGTSSSATNVNAGQPFQGQSIIITSRTTTKPDPLNEDEEDENDRGESLRI